jgi:ribA/ribD-fused uncharacterized protein
MINSFRGKYFFLSNFYDKHFMFDGIIYKNAESAFQAQKTLNRNEKINFIGLSGAEAKRLGRKVKLRSDWNNVKCDIMKEILIAKFKDEELKRLLLSTGNEELIEGNTWGDRYWGVCNGVGKNMLGKLLMEVRDFYRKEEK